MEILYLIAQLFHSSAISKASPLFVCNQPLGEKTHSIVNSPPPPAWLEFPGDQCFCLQAAKKKA